MFVGEHPASTSGNAGMMLAILNDIDREVYDVSVFALESLPPDPVILMKKPSEFPIITGAMVGDQLGREKLMKILDTGDLDALIMVGLDLWVYSTHLEHIKNKCVERNIKWVAFFPYDLQTVREDWVHWIKYYTHPYVYSKWGEDLLKEVVPNIKYFRPPLRALNYWKKKDAAGIKRARSKIFPSISKETLIFGFVGANQIRKDPQKVLKAFSLAKQNTSVDIRLYLHTTLKGFFDLQQYGMDCGLKTRDVLTIRPGQSFSVKGMVDLYNALDCLVNCSIQEGLSWTLVEAMLCGTPFIASKTTAQIELLEGAGYPLDCSELAFVPLIGGHGNTWIEGKGVKTEDLAEAICTIAEDASLRESLSEAGLKKGKEWAEGVSNINDVLNDVFVLQSTPEIEEVGEIEAVLFAQHSSAGDVLMTTQCFKGIKERYGLPLHYMTSEQYMDIVENNPYLDKIISWTNNIESKYKFVLNPHGNVIAPGHWGRNSNSILSDFYWKILDIEPDDFFIDLKQPDIVREDEVEGSLSFFEKENKKIGTEVGIEIVDTFSSILVPVWTTKGPICILHTTGGDSRFRIYKFMKDVHEGLQDRYTTVQLGGANDFPAWADVDLRGKLSFRETAWVMSKASIAVTVDSFLSHLAGALGISQVCLFGSGNSNVVQPHQVKGELICMTPDYVKDCLGLGPCSASVRDCPATCTGRHNPKDILKAIEEIERRLQ